MGNTLVNTGNTNLSVSSITSDDVIDTKEGISQITSSSNSDTDRSKWILSRFYTSINYF